MGRESRARVNAKATGIGAGKEIEEGDLDKGTGLQVDGKFPEVKGFVPFSKRTPEDRTPRPEEIVFGYAHGAMVHEVWSRSKAKMFRADKNIVALDHESSCNLPLNRNTLLHRFMAQERGLWYLFTDTDISFPTFTASAMLRVAQDTRADIVVVPYLLTNGCSTNARALEGGGYYTQGTFKLDRAYEVDAAGTGCMMLSREILSRMEAKYADLSPWEFCGYDRITLDGKPTYESEDYSLCRRAREAGARIVSYTGIILGHSKHELLSFKGTGDLVIR